MSIIGHRQNHSRITLVFGFLMTIAALGGAGTTAIAQESGSNGKKGESKKEAPPVLARQAPPGLKTGTVAPAFEGVNLQDGKPLSLKKLTTSGKYVWILFWRLYTCGSCRQQLAEINAEYRRIKKLGGEIVAITSNTTDQVKRTMLELAIEYPMLSDSEFKIIDLYKVHNLGDNLAAPATFIVDNKGKIIFSHVAPDISHRVRTSDAVTVFQSFLGAGPAAR